MGLTAIPFPAGSNHPKLGRLVKILGDGSRAGRHLQPHSKMAAFNAAVSRKNVEVRLSGLTPEHR